MKDWNLFQLGVVAIFVVLLMAGVAIFAKYGGVRGEQVGSVVIWGTLDRALVEDVLLELAGADSAFQTVIYVEKVPEKYREELTEAIARGLAPDVAIIDDTDVVSFQGKLQVIPYRTLSQRAYLDTYIDISAQFLLPEGILGMPFLVDPLVMYYNRDLFAGAGLTSYPRTWTELQSIAPRMTSLDGTSNVRRSAVALGAYSNVNHAKEILSMLLIQAGDRIATRSPDGSIDLEFGENRVQSLELPAEAVLRYYSNFANPAQSSYSWNRALPNSFNAFTAGDVGVYFGFASEYETIVARNPNLAVGVAVVPQTSASRSPLTYGRILALALPRGSANPVGGAVVAQRMADAEPIAIVAAQTGLPPVRRDVIAASAETNASDSIGSVFAQSALIARTWQDPSPQATNQIFRDMVESVISGRERLDGAVSAAQTALRDLFGE